MVLKVHGGFLIEQYLTGNLRHYSVIGADFTHAISDGTFIIPDGGGPGIDLVIGQDQPVPDSAAAIIINEITKQATVVITSVNDNGMYFALENDNNNWTVADLQTMIRALGTVGVDGVDVSTVTVLGTSYLLEQGDLSTLIGLTDTANIAVPNGILRWNSTGTLVEYVDTIESENITTDTSSFTGNLSPSDSNVQLAMETIDQMSSLSADEIQDLMGSTIIGGADITSTYVPGASGTGTITLDVVDSFLRKDGDTLDSGTLNIASGASLTVNSGASLTVNSGGTITITDAPTSSTDAANKNYVDTVAQGLDPKESVATSTVTDLSATYSPAGGTAGSGSFTSAPTMIDGYALSDSDRVLVKNQLDAKQNGIYEVITAASGDWQRAPDQDGTPASEVSTGNFTFVENGTQNISTGWVITSGTGILTLNVDNIDWNQFSGAGTYTAGEGLALNGTEFFLDVNNLTTDSIVLADHIAFNDTSDTNLTKKVTFSNVLSDLNVINDIGSNGIAVQSSNDSYVARTIVASAIAGQEGTAITNGNGIAGNMLIGIDVDGLVSSSSDLSATDEIIVFDGTNNISMTGQQLADGVSTVLNFVISTINGQPVATMLDTTRSKQLSTDTASYSFSENRLYHDDWIDIGNAVDANSGYILPLDATIVFVTAHCENTSSNDKDVHLFVNGSDEGSIGTLSGGTNATFVNTTLDVDVDSGDRIRLRAIGALSGSIQDTVVTVSVRWRA